ncbi:hypothetical protein [Nocardia cyriacigeorgica]|uniref:hypothetical protein n=1 Tax=Nocardia cyriacigeorgica TaxID=135487 RepID=UPI0024557D7B|nr:hypothetical protein [Nocardia cyriacigeorgica]
MPAQHPLAKLIDDVRTRNQWSYADIAERAGRAGYPTTRQNLSRICLSPVVSLTESTIRLLAAGLDIPASEIAHAAMASMGIPVPGHSDLGSAIVADATLSATNRRLLLSLYHSMLVTQDDEE